IRQILPGIAKISPEILLETTVINNGLRRSAKLVGIENDYFELFNYQLKKGNYFDGVQMDTGLPVCIIGSRVESRFFPGEEALGKYLKVGKNWMKVIGVLEERSYSKKMSNIGNLGIRDFNMDIYSPVKTVLMRYKNRSLVNSTMLQRARMNNDDDGESKVVNYNQLDKIIVQMAASEKLVSGRNVLARMLERRHYATIDYEITIPEMLLKQQQRTKSIFNFVLGAIAGISLLVGGIGIMNIMLASVMERIKEIGLRLAVGAQKKDIISQFLFEAIMISVSGGLVGVILGVTIAVSLSKIVEIQTEISAISIILSFGVAAAVGLIFGITPAKRAAQQDPISSLRHE
ncbi:MAG: ABC transporter permease, partial [Cyclobacteriaceae bacterium]|nr:ABC transporter permease [Cyclobacteriaceae bacterium]